MRFHLKILTAILLLAAANAGMAQNDTNASRLANGEWYKIGIVQEGIHKLTTEQLPELLGKRSNGIALYGLRGGMLSEVNQKTDVSDLKPIPILVNDNNGNGQFDQGDYLLFFAEEASVWRYNHDSQRFEYERHAYDTKNYYYLTHSASGQKSITKRKAAVGATATVGEYTSVAIHDEDLVNAYNSGRIYVGEKFTLSSPSHTIELAMDGTPRGSISCRYAIATVNASGTASQLSLGNESDRQTLNMAPGYYEYRKDFAQQGSSRLAFTLAMEMRNSQASCYLDYIEVNAQCPTRFSGGMQEMRFKPQGEDFVFSIAGNVGAAKVWDVSDPLTTYELEPIASGNTYHLTGGEAHKVIVFDGSQYLAPATIEKIGNQNLHALQDIDYVIVTHKKYTTQAGRIADMHRLYDMMNVAVVSDEQVYNEFSSGKQDPMAIRGLMRMLWERADEGAGAVRPRYLLLFGKGSYDNRNIEGLGETTVVTYESFNSFHETGSYGSDDFFGFLEEGESGSDEKDDIDIGIGRLSARDNEEADHLVEKIISYVRRDDLSDASIRSDWRNYVMLLADDADHGSPGDTLFAHSSEDLANAIKANHGNINIERIYADAFTQQSGAIGSTYPDVNNAIKRRMDLGCLLTNYIGHGSMQYIGTERYISPSDIEGYANHKQPTFFVSSTCTFGKYDMPGGKCGSEMLMWADGGAVGCISASRPIYHIETFNTDLCNLLLTSQMSVGDALRQAKKNTPVSHSISLLGDPAMRLSLPRNQVVITEINGQTPSDANRDSAAALSIVTIKGEIRDNEGALIYDFDGNLFSTIYDRETIGTTLANDNENTELRFFQQKNILYKGATAVEKGHFEYTFTVPRDISFDYGKGRISHYANSEDDDAAGNYDRLYFGGFDTTSDFAILRPQIRLYMNDTNFRSGAITDATPTMFAILSDSVGINAVGSGLGHDITATIDDNGNSLIVLNDMYETDIDDGRNGTIRYTLPSLTAGYHTLTLKAWNIYNYSNSATITFYVRPSAETEVGQFASYPNPATSSTQLRIEHNAPNKIASATIDIFNYQGRLVRHFEPAVAENSYVVGPVRWDMDSDAGTPMPNGIYPARMTLITHDGAEITKTTKIVKIQ